MKQFLILLLLCLGLIAVDKRPNIIVILSDDVGYSDIGCYGGEIETPALDALAKNGLRFTEFYNTARCWTTRASLMTGTYSQQSYPLHDHVVTIPELLQKAGYQTGMVGKWHLAAKPTDKHSPINRGFERYYGTLNGAGSFWHPPTLTRNDESIKIEDIEEGYYYTDVIGNEAVGQIDEFVKSDTPFFQYIAFTAGHWPLHAPEKTIQKYLPKYKDGWEKLREDRYERMLKMGLITKERWPLPKWEKRVKSWESVDHKEWRIRNMAIYAAMVDHMDQAIAKVVKALKKHDELNNTLILFLNDNGACPEHLSGNGWNTANNVIDWAKRTEQKLVVGDKFDVPNGGPLTYGSLGHNWANACNVPLQRYKANVHEGGSNTPFIVHYPNMIKTTGGLVHETGHLVDLMPTFLELAETSYPDSYNTHKLLPKEGVSILKAFRGEALPERPIYLNHSNTKGLRYGKWKIVSEYKRPWALYDIEKEKTEITNLAGKMPEKLKELVTIWNEIDKRVKNKKP